MYFTKINKLPHFLYLQIFIISNICEIIEMSCRIFILIREKAINLANVQLSRTDGDPEFPGP